MAMCPEWHYTTREIGGWRHDNEPVRASCHVSIRQSPSCVMSQRPVTRSFDVFFDLRLNKRLSKQSWGWWFETLPCPLWRHCNVHQNNVAGWHEMWLNILESDSGHQGWMCNSDIAFKWVLPEKLPYICRLAPKWIRWHDNIVTLSARNCRRLWRPWKSDSMFAPSQWETVLLCNDASHWLDASLESALW